MTRARDLADRTIANAALPKAGGTMTGNIVMGDDTSIGIGDAAERIEFDGAGDISVLGAKLGVGITAPVGGLVTLETTLDGADDADQDKFPLMFQNPADDTDEEIGMGFRISAGQAADVTPGGAITFERTGSGSVGSLRFKTSPSEGTLTSRMIIDKNGNVGINGPPTTKFSMGGTSAYNGAMHIYTQAGYGGIACHANDTSGAEPIYQAYSTSTIKMRIYADGDGENVNGQWGGALSDERLKINITDANSQWDDVKNINIVNFKRLVDGENDFSRIGVIAQQVAEVSPNLVKERKPDPEEVIANPIFGTLYEEGDEIPDHKKVGDVKEVKEMVKKFKDSIFFWKCAKALQEAMERIETLEAENTALKTRLDALEARVTALEG